MKLLIADDDLTSRTILAAMSRKWGYDPVVVEDGEAAWEIIQEPEPPHLMLLDWMMPRLDGLGLCRRIRQSVSSDPPFIILLTARNETDDVVAGLDAGANDYIVKPFDNAELQARLQVGKRMLSLQDALNTEISERRKLQEQLKMQASQLEQRVIERTRDVTQLLEQKNAFIRRLGHDLKTPLTPLTALLPLALQSTRNDDNKKILSMAIEQTGFIQSLVEKTLLLAQLNSPNTHANLESVELGTVISKILRHLDHQFSEHDAVVVNNVDTAISVHANPMELEQLFQNLLTNALKYSDEHTTITLDAWHGKEGVTISVADQGIGMDSEQIDKVFEEFWKACDARNDLASHGLGLNICKSIVDRHGGHIWAESPGVGQGTTMYFNLPHPSDTDADTRVSDSESVHGEFPEQLTGVGAG